MDVAGSVVLGGWRRVLQLLGDSRAFDGRIVGEPLACPPTMVAENDLVESLSRSTLAQFCAAVGLCAKRPGDLRRTDDAAQRHFAPAEQPVAHAHHRELLGHQIFDGAGV